MTRSPKVLVAPRDPNPYQSLLYSSIEERGWRVRYSEGPTRSPTLNVLAKPLLLIGYRCLGFRLLHLHWIHDFSLRWARRSKIAARAIQWWFAVYLWIARLLGYRIVWTAHNVVPHSPVFFDDVAARRTLIHRSSAVIALSQASVAELEKLGANDVHVIPYGSYGALYSTTHDRDRTREMLGLAPSDLAALLIGRIERYKGADCLLDAAARLESGTNVRVIVAGECADPQYRSKLAQLAHDAHGRAQVELNHLPDESMARYLGAADFAVFPFREVTNSSSIVLAMSHGLPVILPRLPQFDGLPEQAAIRYDATAPNGLLEALREAASHSATKRAAMASAARSYADSFDWSVVGKATQDLYVELLNR